MKISIQYYSSYLFEKYRKLLNEKYNMSQGEIDENLKDWIKKRGNSEISLRDFIWSRFNYLLLEHSKNSHDEISMYNSQQNIYWDMKGMLIDEGRDYKHIIKQIIFISLKIFEIKDNDFKFESDLVIDCPNCCEECNKHNGIKTTIRKELANQFLPIQNCTRKWGCHCFYSQVAKRNEKGRLIRKPNP